MDIVKQLRNHALPDPNDEREVTHAPLLKKAANEIEAMKFALDRIANMKNRDGVEIEMHRDELRAIAKTAMRHNEC